MIKLFDDPKEKQKDQWTMEDVKEYVKTLMTYEEEISALQESKREWSKEFLDKKDIPKKELTQAIQIMKKELNTDTIFDMTSAIMPEQE